MRTPTAYPTLAPAKAAKAALAAVAVSVLVGGCATPSGPEPSWQQKLASTGWKVGPEMSSVPGFAVRSFDPLDDQHLVVDLGASRRVLVTTGPGCIDLDDAKQIAWRNFGFGSTLSRFDKLHSAPVGLQPSNCRVEEIHQLLPPAA